MVLRWWANVDGKAIIGTLPDSEDMRHQVRREALAGVLTLEAAALEVDLSDAVVILRNDATGAISRKAAHFAVTVIVNVAAAICVVAAVVHAIMSEELLLAFKVGVIVDSLVHQDTTRRV